MTARESRLVTNRIAIDADPRALALAAEAWSAIERPIQMAAIAEFVTEGKRDELVLIAAYCESRLCGAVLGQILPGLAAVVWRPQLAAGQRSTIAMELLCELHRQLRAAGVRIAQCLLENARGGAADLLRGAGYLPAGEILSMAAEFASFPEEAPRLEFDLEPYVPSAHGRFVRLVETTYRGSLDLRAVDGIGDTADALASYRGASQFRPDLWLLASCDGQDVGCLLLADHPGQEQIEIVYLGVAPPSRGRGWGLALARHALWLARQMGRKHAVLAVDAANQPAVAAYQAAGFVGWDLRCALLYDFRLAAKQDKAST